MTATNKGHIITNEIVWIRQLIFLHITFLSLSKHANINLPNRRFSHEQILIPKYSLILHALYFTCSPHWNMNAIASHITETLLPRYL